MKMRNSIMVSVVISLLWAGSTFAIVGAGFHWGFDFTLKMDDKFDDRLALKQLVPLQLIDTASIPDLGNYLPSGITVDSLHSLMTEHLSILEASSPFSLTRKDWSRSVINFGGKIFIDVIPVLDAIELSFNIGAWEYDASLKYPTDSIQPNITVEDINEFVQSGDYEKILVMAEMPLTLEEFGLSYLKMFGLSKTPYVKMQFDLSVRKNIIAVPKKMKIFKLYAGGGPSLHLGTPVVTPAFVEKVIASTVESAGNNITTLSSGMTEPLLKEVVNKLIEDSKTPTFGMHIIVGTMIKPPVIPVGFYADAKFMIPFGEIDRDVELGGVGFLINAGISLSL